MGILDQVIPVFYEVLRMGIQRVDDDIVVTYDVMLRNMTEDRICVVTPNATLTDDEKQAIRSIFLRDKVAFETATALIEYIKVEEPPQ